MQDWQRLARHLAELVKEKDRQASDALALGQKLTLDLKGN